MQPSQERQRTGGSPVALDEGGVTLLFQFHAEVTGRRSAARVERHGQRVQGSSWRRHAMVPGVAVLAAAVLFTTLVAVPAGAVPPVGSDRYAANDGSGTACTQVAPCALSQAITGAVDGDTVHVASGNYGAANAPLQLTISHAITVVGEAGPQRPVLFSDTGSILTIAAANVTVSDLSLQNEGWGNALQVDGANAVVDRVIAFSAGKAGSGSTACSVSASAEIRNTVCDDAYSDGFGAVVAGSGTITVTLRNDTIEGSGQNGRGLLAQTGSGNVTVNVTNTILRGGSGIDINAYAPAGSSVIVNVDHSNYGNPYPNPPEAVITPVAGNQSAAPVFRGSYDFHEQSSSPTVNAGIDDAANGSEDLDGNPRGTGGTDIGAYEYLDAPAATTGGVTSPGRTTATLTGTINPNGVDTTSFFEYGTSTAVDQVTGSVDSGSGTSDVSASVDVSGLQPATTYYYRVVGSSNGGDTFGETASFRTTDVPAVTTGSPSEIDETSATVAATVNPQGLDTTYSVDYGTAPTSLTSTATGGDAGSGVTPQDETVELTGLQPSTTYYYRVVATNADGASTNTDSGTFTTPTPPTIQAGTPTDVTETAATLQASVNPNGGTTSYHFEYRPSSGGAYTSTAVQTLSGGVTPQAVSAHVTGLAAGTTYTWRAVAAHATSGAVAQTVPGADFHTTDIPVGTTPPPQAGGGDPGSSASVPRITALRVTTTRLTRRHHGARRSRVRISYRDTAAATTTFTIERAMPGIRHGSRCAAPPRHGRAHGRPCTRYVRVRGSFRHRGVAGTNSLAFPPRIGNHVLKPGRYLLVATPTAVSGTRGRPTSARLVIRT
jgi:hypothetical protein